MEIRQLRYFVNAAKTQSFTEAARLSNVAQSTLSQQVRQLETELDVELFHREGKHIQLTAEGNLFLTDAQRILDDARQGLQRLADQKQLQGGNISIGLASGLGISAVLTEVLTEYNKTYPKVLVSVHQMAAPLLANKLRQHEIDLAMTFTPDAPEEDLKTAPLFGTRICAVMGEHHPLASHASVSMKQLALQPLVLPTPALIIRSRIDQAALRQGLTLSPAAEIDDISHIIYMLRSRRWVSLLPDVATLAVRGLARIPLTEAIPLPTSVMTLAGVYQRKAVTEFLRMLQTSVHLLLQSGKENCEICGETFISG